MNLLGLVRRLDALKVLEPGPWRSLEKQRDRIESVENHGIISEHSEQVQPTRINDA